MNTHPTTPPLFCEGTNSAWESHFKDNDNNKVAIIFLMVVVTEDEELLAVIVTVFISIAVIE